MMRRVGGVEREPVAGSQVHRMDRAVQQADTLDADAGEDMVTARQSSKRGARAIATSVGFTSLD